MNTANLRRIFQSKFDYQTYCNEIVHNIFGCNDVAVRPELLDTTAEGDECNYIGRMTDTNGRELGFFYTRVASGSDVRRKRVGLRKMIAPYLKYDVDAAIAVFADENHWRLSYICDMKEGVTNAKRFSYILGDEQGQYKTPLERLDTISTKRGRYVLNDLREAFSVDALSDEFFDEYHIHYDRIVAELARQGKSGAVYHDYVKKLMGRIVFLHFLQKKGWLCGDTSFMLNTFSQSNRRGDYLESVLEPLFFGILNTEPSKREQVFSRNGWQQGLVEKWASIPYLNGGLFERDEVDNLRIVLPESIFSNLFSFLASYNFTVDENDPDDAEIGVDPEMLGKIFESLLEDNKAKGAFYTPKEIVRYMCKESLIAHLASKLPDVADGVVRAFVESHEMQPELEPCRNILESALREAKICDPAIGSGAFPMGLLNELWRCREALGTQMSRLQLKKEIIENNIYGVDIERGAIDIARLRFWLSIVVDSEKAEPLPNFDYKFMQGNSLIESYGGFDLSRIAGKTVGRPSTSTQYVIGLDSDLSQKNLQRLLREYFSVTDHQKKATMRHAINAEVKTLIRESVGGTPTFLAKLEQLDPSANQDFFLWHTWFKDIFDKGGFDIVIGNPPYINVEKVDKYIKENINLFSTAYQKFDMYVLFYEVGIKLLKKGGVLSFITSNKFLSQGYGLRLRQLLLTKQIDTIVNFNYDVFDAATVRTCILVLINAGAKGDFHIRIIDINEKKDRFKFEQGIYSQILESTFLNTEENNFRINLTTEKTRLLKKIQKWCLCVEDICSVNYGLRPSSEVLGLKKEAFIHSQNTTGTFERYFEGKDMGYWLVKNYQYIDYRPDVMYNAMFPELFKNEKLVGLRTLSDITKLRYVYDDTGMFCNDSVVILTLWKLMENVDYISIKRNITNERINNSKRFTYGYLQGILNSKLIKFYFNELMYDGTHFYPNHMKKMPIKDVSIQQQESIAVLVKRIIDGLKHNPNFDVSTLVYEVDQRVYQLYNLTPEEIAIIENNS